MERRDPDGGGRVPDEELAEIARQLRGVLGGSTGQPPPPPRRAVTPRRTPGSATVMLRFMAAFIAPGLLLVAALVVNQMLS